MSNNNGGSNQKQSILDKHLRELSKNFSDDKKDWINLRVRQRQEIELIGWSSFSNWNQQYQEIIRLASFHKEKHTILKYRQSKEIDSLGT